MLKSALTVCACCVRLAAAQVTKTRGESSVDLELGQAWKDLVESAQRTLILARVESTIRELLREDVAK